MKRLDWSLIGILVLPIVFFIGVKLMVGNFHHTICLYKLLTGHDCWGCGMTRAFNQLFQLNFKAAYDYNPRIVIVAPLMFILWVQTFVNYIKHKNKLTVCEIEDR